MYENKSHDSCEKKKEGERHIFVREKKKNINFPSQPVDRLPQSTPKPVQLETPVDRESGYLDSMTISTFGTKLKNFRTETYGTRRKMTHEHMAKGSTTAHFLTLRSCSCRARPSSFLRDEWLGRFCCLWSPVCWRCCDCCDCVCAPLAVA